MTKYSSDIGRVNSFNSEKYCWDQGSQYLFISPHTGQRQYWHQIDTQYKGHMECQYAETTIIPSVPTVSTWYQYRVQYANLMVERDKSWQGIIYHIDHRTGKCDMLHDSSSGLEACSNKRFFTDHFGMTNITVWLRMWQHSTPLICNLESKYNQARHLWTSMHSVFKIYLEFVVVVE